MSDESLKMYAKTCAHMTYFAGPVTIAENTIRLKVFM